MPRQRIRFVLSAISLTAASFCFLAATAVAQQKQNPGDQISGPGLFIFFEGDEPGKTIASTLGKLIENQTLLRQAAIPVKYHVIEQRDTVCKILYDQGYPLPCTREILDIVERLNPKTEPVKRGLQVETPLFLPELHLEKYAARRWVPANEANDMVKNWRALNADISRKSDGLSYVRFDAYRIFVPAASDEAATKILQLVSGDTRPANIKVDFVPGVPVLEKQNSAGLQSEQAWRAWCEQTTAKQLIRYRDLSVSAETAQGDGQAGPIPVAVHIVDGPVHVTPSLRGALAETPATTPLPAAPANCAWVPFSKPYHHATHMAGIIASRDNGSGLLGIAPLATIHPFPWLKADGKVAVAASATRGPDLSRLIDKNNDKGVPIPVYLIATEFPQPPSNGTEILDRFRYIVPSSIRGSAGIFVVAAGQADDGQLPAALSVDSDISPQNLGDQENVIVVTACVDCMAKQPRILAAANKSASAENPAGVHLAAPGGSVIGSWVGDGQFSVSSGTSQAAAFVAGVAAQMIGRYKDVYKDGLAVKKRLQVTTYPANWSDDDAKKLSVGIVDPRVALLDPSKTWIKENGKWRDIDIKPLTATELFNYRDGDLETPAAFSSVGLLRVMRTTEGKPAERRWDFYVDGSRIKPKAYKRGHINRVRSQIPSGVLQQCGNNPPINWVDVEDLIVAATGSPC
jgi:hypothetical protein